jgi:GNAT superfamily N-acetyltransferase
LQPFGISRNRPAIVAHMVAEMHREPSSPRLATPIDADEVGRRLHDFNTEFGDPSPGASLLAERLRALLATKDTFAVVVGAPVVGVALVTLRPNVWYAGPVALLDELYVVPGRRRQGIGSALVGELLAVCRTRGVELVEINVDEGDVDAMRFYEHHGFTATEPGSTERAIYYWQESPTRRTPGADVGHPVQYEGS